MKNNFNSPLKLRGGKLLSSRIIPGPMEGIMGPVFIKAMSELNLTDLWITPFIRVTTGVPRFKTLSHKLKCFLETGKPLIVQLLGIDPEIMGGCAKRLEEMGVVGVNLNFACPSQRVVKKKGGGGALQELSLMKEIIDAIRSNCPNLSLSLKVRSGFESHNESEQFLPKICSDNIDFIVYHFRTVKESYIKIPNPYLRIKRAVELAGNTPLIGSGDIFSLNDAIEMVEISNCAGVTVARGLLKSPYLIREIEASFAGKIKYSKPFEQEQFFNKMLEIAATDVQNLWRKTFFIELAVAMWGKEHPNFSKVANLTVPELIF